jgi:NAD(P)H-nitrite reductase large subunit
MAVSQGRTAGENIVRDHQSAWSIPPLSSTLKVAGIKLVSLGDVSKTDVDAVFCEIDPEAGLYCRITVEDGIVTGAVMIGDVRLQADVRKSLQQKAPVSSIPALAGLDWRETTPD